MALPKITYVYLNICADRYVHSPLPWLGVRADCYVTLAHSPSFFWVQVKSPQLDDLVKITDLIQNACEVGYLHLLYS